MKAFEKIQTDDLNEEQKKILSDMIKKEMITKIEDSVKGNSTIFADQIKKLLHSDEESEKKDNAPPPK